MRKGKICGTRPSRVAWSPTAVLPGLDRA